MTPQAFQKSVLRWFKTHGRKTLPWQHNKTPYRVWLSEIMLQQTQVSTVIPYYKRFLKRFPSLTSLAQAKEDEVLHLWSGLGYYSRARNLHKSAKMIQEKYQGEFPDTLEAIQQLPGVGRSTAGAILSCAFNKKAAILDGNVKRLLTRFHAVTTAIDSPETLKRLWEISEAYTPSKKVAAYTQVMMDLGATLCTRSNPRCSDCPLVASCQAHQQGLVDALPLKKTKRSLPVKQVTFLVLEGNKKVLLQKRPSKGIWGGLWSLPELSGRPSLKAIQAFCQETFQLLPKKAKALPAFRHSFSHYHLDILPLVLKLDKLPAKAVASKTQIWYSVQRPESLGLPAPVQTLLENMQR